MNVNVQIYSENVKNEQILTEFLYKIDNIVEITGGKSINQGKIFTCHFCSCIWYDIKSAKLDLKQ